MPLIISTIMFVIISLAIRESSTSVANQYIKKNIYKKMDEKLTPVVLQLLPRSSHLSLAQFSLTFAQFIK